MFLLLPLARQLSIFVFIGLIFLGCENSSRKEDSPDPSDTTGSVENDESTTQQTPSNNNSDPTDGESDQDTANNSTTSGTHNSEESSDSGPKFDVEIPSGSETGIEPRLQRNAHLEGVVYSPEGTIPVSGALVYVSPDPLDGVPDGVYCEKCVELPANAAWTLTNEDGSFALDAPSGESMTFAVQKGQFLRSSFIDIQKGEQAVEGSLTTLPNKWDPDMGEWIPRMAIAFGGNDRIHDLMAKVGLGEVNDAASLVEGSEQFDIYQGISDENFQTMLNDLELMKRYHIIFLPCGSQNTGFPITDSQKENIRKWVELGGKWYVTDYANEFLYEVFPTYQEFYQGPPSNTPDIAAYDTEGTVKDADLLNWLEALPAELKDPGNDNPTLFDLPQVQILASFSALVPPLPEIPSVNEDGEDINIGHYTWIEGSGEASAPPSDLIRPMTVSAQHGCGKMLFSTYHTTSTNSLKLLPQELVLWYLILEIGVCQESLPQPVG